MGAKVRLWNERKIESYAGWEGCEFGGQVESVIKQEVRQVIEGIRRVLEDN